MAGEIKRLLDQIIQQRARGDELIVQTTQAKLIFKGINPSRFTSDSPDEPIIIAKIKAIAADLGVNL
ncbi:MAG TPA: hypothetical protein VMH04_18605 [Candidatus Solibacter sp.]|nr:hypothetical protein [Candidatus Solibacter sp.]